MRNTSPWTHVKQGIGQGLQRVWERLGPARAQVQDLWRSLALPYKLVFVAVGMVFLIIFPTQAFPWDAPSITASSQATWYVGAIGIVFVLIVLLFLLWRLPKRKAARLTSGLKEQFDIENETRKTWATIVGGIAVLFSLLFAWGNLRVTQDNLHTTQTTAAINQDLTREGQITDRFTNAIAQLGEENSEKMMLRIGGIYALERIAKDSKKDHWPIMEILTAFVRKETPMSWKAAQLRETSAPVKDDPLQKFVRKERCLSRKAAQLRETSAPVDVNRRRKSVRKETCLPQEADQCRKTSAAANVNRHRKFQSDIVAVLTVLKQRNWEDEKKDQQIPLSYEENGQQTTGNYTKKGEHLNLRSIDLSDVNLAEAQLNGALLEGAYLENAGLWEAQLRGAQLYGVVLRNARLIKANLREANLWRADLTGANFLGAELEGADVREARLKEAKNLTVDQLDSVKNLDLEEIDKSLREALHQKDPQKYPKLTPAGPQDAKTVTAGGIGGCIEHPKDGEKVGEQITIHGSIHNPPTDGQSYLWLAVQKGGRIWPKYPKVPITGSSWAVTVYEGETPPGHSFYLDLYLVRNKGKDDAGNKEKDDINEWLQLGNETTAFPGLKKIAESTLLDRIKLHMLECCTDASAMANPKKR
jgi:uncharacterized protein YjbI with pentapeptide repeats